MKFTVSSSVLEKHLSSLSGVIASNPIVPILENFLFDLSPDKLQVSASDLQISMTTVLNVDTSDTGAIAVPAKLLLDVLKSLPEQPLTFTIDEDGQTVHLDSFKGQYKFVGERAEDFPKLPSSENTERIDISSEILENAINNTLLATGNDDMRPAMTGVYVKIDQEAATFVATDAHRLVRYVRKDLKNNGEPVSVIIPKKAFNLLKNNLPSQVSLVQAEFGTSNAFFTFNNIRLISRLIDESFPDYENAIPTENPNVMSIDKAELISSLKRLALFANKATNQIRLKLQSSKLEIFAEDLDFYNEGSESLLCEYQGEELEIGFNVKFLIDMFSNVSGEEVELHLSTPNRAGIILPKVQAEDEDLLALVMPVSISSYAD